LLDVIPITPQVLQEIRERILHDTEGKNSQKPQFVNLRNTMLTRLDEWRSLNNLIGDHVDEARGKKVVVVKAGEQSEPSPQLEFNLLEKTAPPNQLEVIWQATQQQLRAQVTEATYNSVLVGTELVYAENGVWVVACRDSLQQETLQIRLHDTVKRALETVTGNKVELKFIEATKEKARL
jgi:hypothetical protein